MLYFLLFLLAQAMKSPSPRYIVGLKYVTGRHDNTINAIIGDIKCVYLQGNFPGESVIHRPRIRVQSAQYVDSMLLLPSWSKGKR